MDYFYIIISFIALIPVLILFYYYKTTRIVDYIVFSGAFIALFLERLIFALTKISDITVYSTRDSKVEFLMVQWFFNFLAISSWYLMFIIAYRSRKTSRSRLWLLLISFYAILLLILNAFRSVENIPGKGELFGISLYSQMNTQGDGAILIINQTIIVGQGFDILQSLFSMTCSLYFLYSIIRSNNTFNHPRFAIIRLFWISSMISYLGSRMLVISSLLFNSGGYGLGFNILQLWAALSFVIIAVFIPEGFLLSNLQIARAVKLYKDQIHDNRKIADESKSGLLSKVLEYIEFMEKNFDQNQIEKYNNE